jgi:hypothetical protein
MAGYVYLMKCTGSPTVKIGRSYRDPRKRKSEFQTGNPFPIEVLWAELVSDPVAGEKILHRHFHDRQTLNEWFDLGDDPVAAFREAFRLHVAPLHSLSWKERGEALLARFDTLPPRVQEQLARELLKMKKKYG